MWTQRDQIQAYQFLRRRLVSALVSADANHPVSPTRRVVVGTVLGVLGTVLVVGGFAISGVLHPPANTQWRNGGQVIVEKETGTRFVLGQDRHLHPVVNYASARLLAGGDGTKTVTVRAATLAAAPRGAAVGIVGAPDSLPTPGRLLAGPWTVCSQAPADRPRGAGPVSTLVLGGSGAGTLLGAGQGVVVQTPSAARFLLADGRRFRLDGATVAAALGYDAAPALPVSAAFVNAVPAGRDLALLTVPAVGSPAGSIGGAPVRVGQVVQVGTVGTAVRYYVIRADGITSITQTEANLVLSNPVNRSAYGSALPAPRVVAAYDIASARRSAQSAAAGYPQFVPVPVAVPDTSAVCATGDGLSAASLFVAAAPPLPRGALPSATGAAVTGADSPVADQVYVPAASGALVAVAQAPDAPPGTVYVVTDTGRKYPVPDSAAVSALGFGSAHTTAVAPSVLALLPTGVTLDPAAAQQVVSAGAR